MSGKPSRAMCLLRVPCSLWPWGEISVLLFFSHSVHPWSRFFWSSGTGWIWEYGIVGLHSIIKSKHDTRTCIHELTVYYSMYPWPQRWSQQNWYKNWPHRMIMTDFIVSCHLWIPCHAITCGEKATSLVALQGIAQSLHQNQECIEKCPYLSVTLVTSQSRYDSTSANFRCDCPHVTATTQD